MYISGSTIIPFYNVNIFPKNNTVSDQYPTRPSSSWTTRRPQTPLPPITQRPPQRNPISPSIYFPTQPPYYATTTVRPINQQNDFGNRNRPGSNTKKGTTTEAPSLFHSSDYDDDLDLTNRFGNQNKVFSGTHSNKL